MADHVDVVCIDAIKRVIGQLRVLALASRDHGIPAIDCPIFPATDMKERRSTMTPAQSDNFEHDRRKDLQLRCGICHFGYVDCN